MSEHDRIKEVRKALGLTQDKFGERLGVGGSAISNIEAGTRGVTDQLRLAICREFRVNEDWLRTGEDPMILEPAEDEDISRFMGDILTGAPDFRRRLISVLARMTPQEWALLEEKIREMTTDE